MFHVEHIPRHLTVLAACGKWAPTSGHERAQIYLPMTPVSGYRYGLFVRYMLGNVVAGHSAPPLVRCGHGLHPHRSRPRTVAARRSRLLRRQPVDVELRAAAPRDAHHPPPRARARRRARRQMHAAHRIPPQRVREARRAPELQPVRHRRRPHGLLRPDLQRVGVARLRREVDGHRPHPALQGIADHRRRARAESKATSCASGRRGWTSARSPPSSTASTSASTSTTSSSSCPARATTPLGRGWGGSTWTCRTRPRLGKW